MEILLRVIFCIFLISRDWKFGRVISERPNIIFILTDDQDVVLNGLKPLKKTMKLIGEEGSVLRNAFASTPLCCPSRSSILTGLYSHSHGTLNNSIEGGCSGANWRTKHEPQTFGAELNRAGYRTFYAGKYLNRYGHESVGGAKHVPQGWDWWIGLIGNSAYYNYALSVNGSKVWRGSDESDYLTDVLRDYSLMFLNSRQVERKPFLMVVSVPSPHEPFTPARRHVGKFSGFQAPRTPNFDRAGDGTKHWLLRLPPRNLPPETIDKIDQIFRNRWETLLAVDELVEAIVERLIKTERLNNTVILFSSDNGFHQGQFGLPWDKRQPYDTDIRIPMMVRGPNILKRKLNDPVVNIDVAPFILDVAGVKPSRQMDGKSFLSLLTSKSKKPSSRSFLIEYQGEFEKENKECYDDPNVKLCKMEAACKCFDARNNSFFCVRRLSAKAKANDIFCQFEDDDNFREYYDIRRDPFQLDNLAAEDPRAMIRHLVLDCCSRSIRLRKSVEKCFLPNAFPEPV